MARQAVSLTQSTRDGVVVTETTGVAVDGFSVTNDGKVLFLLHNTGASTRTATFITPNTVDDQSIADRAITVAAGVTKLAGPFPVGDYGSTLALDISHAELTVVAVH